MELLNIKKVLIYVLFYLNIINCKNIFKTKKKGFRCISDILESSPILAKNFLPTKAKELNKKRVLDSDGFKDFNIYLDLENFYHEAKEYKIDNETQRIFVKGMNNAISTLKALLKVKPASKNYAFSDEEIKYFNINYWNTEYIGNASLGGMQDLGIDLFIFVTFGNNSNMGEDTLATAGAKFVDPKGLPLIGVAQINRDVNYSAINSLQYFQAIILHEFTHIVGFANHFFTDYYHNILKEVENGIERDYINSTKVLEIGRKYFNCESIKGVLLEDFGGKGTVGSHWEERILLGDYMNGVVYPEEQVISEFTLAVLEDSGNYKAQYYTGGLMQFGKNKGCDFLNKKCVDDEGNVQFKNEFFEGDLENNADPGCSSGRQSRAYHSFFVYETIPEQFRYFNSETIGGRASADYCPVSQEYYIETENLYYAGHCSTKGKGKYGTLILQEGPNGKMRCTNGELASKTGEVYSNNSFCVLSSLYSTKINDYELYSKTIRANCYQMHCSERSLTIQINNDFIVCPRAGGKINAVNFNGYLLCPDYYLICSGTVLCNDMFDCVEKKSLLKDNIVYDYISQTSQDINDAELEEFSNDNYELSVNGKCPQYCSQCNEEGYCIKCKNDYGIISSNEDGSKIRYCVEISDLNGYYLDGNIYYKCMENCEQCDNGQECINCNSNYTTKNNQCFLKINNCEEYDDNGKCTKCEDLYLLDFIEKKCKRGIENCDNFTVIDNNNVCNSCKTDYHLFENACYKDIENCSEYINGESCKTCKEGFAFEEDDRKNCKKIEKFENYYSKDNNISFYKCNGEQGIQNCQKCQNINEDGNDVLKCKRCQTYYVLKDNETDKCYDKSIYIDDKKYYFEDKEKKHVITCSNTITNCEECEKADEKVNCLKCINGFRLSNNNTCVEEIDNCKDYDENNLCIKCKVLYAFEELDRTTCKNKNQFGDYYTKDGTISYYKCDGEPTNGIERIKNCRNCKHINGALQCIQCKEAYIILDDNNKVCELEENYNNNKYFYENQYHIRTCSKNITNCKECEKTENENVTCQVCEEGFLLVNEDSLNCKSSDIVVTDEYYIVDNIYYYCEKYNSIKNCKNCHDKNSCDLCKDGYVFINDEKSICQNKNELGKKYFEDENSIYRKCSDYISNCDTCNSVNECLSCMDNYGLLSDSVTCQDLSDQKYCKNPSDNFYYSCNVIMENCEKCSSYNKCIKCIDGYIKIDYDISTCHPISEIESKYYYINPKDENNYIKCTNYVSNCDSCEYPKGCNLCHEGYILLDDNYKYCYEKEKTNLKSYFTNDNITYYNCKDSKYKNNIQCFSIIPKQNISLSFLQIQIVKFKLICYMITHSPLPRDFSLKLKINVYNSNRRRNLESNERDVVLTITDDSNGSENKIVSFTSDDTYNSGEDVQVQEIQFNDDDTVTKTVTNNNICSLKYEKTSQLLDTGKVKEMIKEKKIPDCSSIQATEIINLNMEKVFGCDFNLNSEEPVSFSGDILDLELVESDNQENTIKAQCDTKKDNIKSIKCTINEDKNVDNIYTFKDGIFSDSTQFITISSEEPNYQIYCEKEGSNKKLIIIIVIIGITLVVIVTVIICCIVYKKKKGSKHKNNMDEKDIIKNRSNIKEINFKPLHRKKKDKAKLNNLEKLNIENDQLETNNPLDIKEEKRRSSIKKSIKRQDKKHKLTKITHKSE